MENLRRFWQTRFGKVAILGGGGVLTLFSLCCACGMLGAIFGDSKSTRQLEGVATDVRVKPIAENTDLETATATRAPTATLLPATATPLPTPSPTAVVLPTDTPLPPDPATATPAVEEQAAVEASGLQEAQVINVVDGDTIDVLIEGVEYRVRYILVDTPETKDPGEPVQPFGPEAYEANRQLVEGRTVRLEKDVSETDRYGRLLRYVYVGELMVNEELLRLGLARVATFPPDVKYVDRFLAVQQEAQAAGAGLWGEIPVVEVPVEPAPAATEPPLVPEPAVPEPPAVTGGNLVITAVDKRSEVVDIQNPTGQPVDLAGWRLLSEKGSQDCALGGVIQPGETLRVWAMSEDAGQGGFNCGFGTNIWNNSERDSAVLIDPSGAEVSRF